MFSATLLGLNNLAFTRKRGLYRTNMKPSLFAKKVRMKIQWTWGIECFEAFDQTWTIVHRPSDNKRKFSAASSYVIQEKV